MIYKECFTVKQTSLLTQCGSDRKQKGKEKLYIWLCSDERLSPGGGLCGYWLGPSTIWTVLYVFGGLVIHMFAQYRLNKKL